MKKQLVLATSAATILASSLFMTSTATAADTKVETDLQKFSYAIGLQIGNSLAQQDFEVDQAALSLAIKDAIEGKEPRVPTAELQRVMAAEQQKAEQKGSLDAEKNLKIGQEFLAENKKKSGIESTESGLQYRIITEGKGPKPTAADTVTVHYRGTLIDGEEFDSSYKREQPATFPLNGVIKGWQEALPMMKEGGKWEIFVPSDLAYGPKSAGEKIGKNETLIFEIELLSIKK